MIVGHRNILAMVCVRKTAARRYDRGADAMSTSTCAQPMASFEATRFGTARSGTVKANQIRQMQRSDCTDRSQGEKERWSACGRAACSGMTTMGGTIGETAQGADFNTRSNLPGGEEGDTGVLSSRWQLHARGCGFAPQQQARSREQPVPGPEVCTDAAKTCSLQGR